MGITVNFTDNSGLILNALPEEKHRALEKVGLRAERNVKKLTPVDTGRLRNSISHDTDVTQVTIGTNVYYGKFVELGTYKMAAQPYLKPGIINHLNEYKEIIIQTLSS